MPRVRHWLTTLALLASASPIFAQSPTATLAGRISDSQGLPVPDAAVTAESPNLQGSRATITSEAGDYVLTLLPPGVYTLSVEFTGFPTTRRTLTLAPTQG